jgi:hypothetical protein
MKVKQLDGLLLAERWKGKDRLVAFMNYTGKNHRASVPSTTGEDLYKIMESCAEVWAGPGALCPDSVLAEQSLDIRANSIVIYSNRTV